MKFTLKTLKSDTDSLLVKVQKAEKDILNELKTVRALRKSLMRAAKAAQKQEEARDRKQDKKDEESPAPQPKPAAGEKKSGWLGKK